MKSLQKKLLELKNYTIMSGELFLHRDSNQFDTSLPLVLYDIECKSKAYKKINDIFGTRDIEEIENYLVVKPKPLLEKTKFTFGDLVEIICRLRDEDGCIWDKEQTPYTIRKNIIEEAYELVEAIELGDKDKICEECGDVLLQGVFTAVMSEDIKQFSVSDALSGLCYKLISRHTHIFGSDKATNCDDALYFWEKAKAVEKNQLGIKAKVESVPTNFSALMKANKVQKIIKKTGFDHPTMQDAVDKIYEEIGEFLVSVGKEREKEAGDVLFSVVNMLRMSDIDPEVALNGTTNRFIKRFMYVVDKAEECGKRVEELTLDEMEVYYKASKVLEKNDNL